MAAGNPAVHLPSGQTEPHTPADPKGSADVQYKLDPIAIRCCKGVNFAQTVFITPFYAVGLLLAPSQWLALGKACFIFMEVLSRLFPILPVFAKKTPLAPAHQGKIGRPPGTQGVLPTNPRDWRKSL